jgi:hypothetical protein
MPPGANCCLLKVLLILSPFVGALPFWNQRVKLSLRGGWLYADSFLPKGAIYL